MKRILITGAGSYIGTSFEKWLSQPQFAGMYQVDTVDMRGDGWREKDFTGTIRCFMWRGLRIREWERASGIYTIR